MEKMMKTANILDVIAKVLFIISIVALCILLAANIAVAFVPEDMIESGAVKYTLSSGHSLIIADGFDPALSKAEITAFLLSASVMAAVELIMLAVGTKVFRKILVPMKQGKPFESGTSDKIKKFGHFVLIFSIVGNFISFMINLVTVHLLNTAEMFENSADFVVGISLDGVIAAIIVYLISYIFRYGEELQKQADETL